MIYVLLFFLGCLSAMEPNEGAGCINIQSLNLKEVNETLDLYELPHNVFNVKLKNEINIRKYFDINTDKDKVALYTLSYDNNLGSIVTQFYFHLDLIKTIQTESYFPYKIYCFTTDEWNYLIFKQRENSIYLFPTIKNFDLKKIEKANVQIMDVFIKLEKERAIFAEATELTWLLTPSGDIQFRAVDLAHVYPGDQYCYAKTTQSFINFFTADSQLSIESTHKGEYYGLVEPQKRWNHIFYLSIIKGFIKEHLRKNVQGQSIKVLKYFGSSLDTIDSKILETRNLITTWIDIKNFVESFGEVNNLIDDSKEKKVLDLKEIASRITRKKTRSDLRLDEMKEAASTGASSRRSPSPKRTPSLRKYSASSPRKSPSPRKQSPSSPKESSSPNKQSLSSHTKLKKNFEDDYEDLSFLILQ